MAELCSSIKVQTIDVKQKNFKNELIDVDKIVARERKNIMQDYFEKDRYNFSNLIHEIQIMEEVTNILVDKETRIEIYGCDKISRNMLINILQDINTLDNQVQDKCKKEFEEGQLGVGNFLFEPSWLSVSVDKVTIGYFGIQVNSDFEKVFVNNDGTWRME